MNAQTPHECESPADRWGGKITGNRGEVPVLVTELDDRGRPVVRVWFRRAADATPPRVPASSH